MAARAVASPDTAARARSHLHGKVPSVRQVFDAVFIAAVVFGSSRLVSGGADAATSAMFGFVIGATVVSPVVVSYIWRHELTKPND